MQSDKTTEYTHVDGRQASAEPSGVSLKAAWLLLRELERYPKTPKVEQVAIILDTVLNFEWAVRLIRCVAEMDSYGGDPDDPVMQFNVWAAENLLQ